MTSIKKTLNITFEEAVVRVQNALKEQGFGIITEIDVKETFKTKLNVDYPKYKILGACNPLLAKKALDADKTVGTVLPCNVAVFETDKGVDVYVQKPTEMMKALSYQNLGEVAREAESRLRKVVDSL
jgi:uncharacterized protein (DUF302 family)